MSSNSGKVFVITGGSSGIGKALAQNALSQGAKVAVCGRDAQKLQNTFGAANENLLCLQADVSIEADCKRMMDTVIAKWGRIDVLINNAGISMRALFEELDLKVLKELMDINFWGNGLLQ